MDKDDSEIANAQFFHMLQTGYMPAHDMITIRLHWRDAAGVVTAGPWVAMTLLQLQGLQFGLTQQLATRELHKPVKH